MNCPEDRHVWSSNRSVKDGKATYYCLMQDCTVKKVRKVEMERME